MIERFLTRSPAIPSSCRSFWDTEYLMTWLLHPSSVLYPPSLLQFAPSSNLQFISSAYKSRCSIDGIPLPSPKTLTGTHKGGDFTQTAIESVSGTNLWDIFRIIPSARHRVQLVHCFSMNFQATLAGLFVASFFGNLDPGREIFEYGKSTHLQLGDQVSSAFTQFWYKPRTSQMLLDSIERKLLIADTLND